MADPGPPGVRVIFDVGSVAVAAREATALGARVLVIAGRHEQAAADKVSGDLGGALADRLDEVTPHVPVEVAAAAVARARSSAVEVVVSIGGGSATGLAKAIALETDVRIVAVPTTYAGSELTPIWGLSDDRAKRTGRNVRVLPATVVYDPALTTSLPASVTASSGMNAMAHCVEALYAPDRTAAHTVLAVEGLRALRQSLPLCVAQPDDISARSRAMYGAWLAGWVLGATRMGLHHKLAHVLGGTYRLPHGGVHSALLPQVTAYNASAARSAMAAAGDALGVAEDAVPALLFDLAHALGAPTSLRSLGWNTAYIDDVASAVMASTVVNPRPVELDGLRSVLRAAYEGERPGATTRL